MHDETVLRSVGRLSSIGEVHLEDMQGYQEEEREMIQVRIWLCFSILIRGHPVFKFVFIINDLHIRKNLDLHIVYLQSMKVNLFKKRKVK